MVLLQCAPHQLFVCTTLNAGIGKLIWKHRHLKHRGEDRELQNPYPLSLIIVIGLDGMHFIHGCAVCYLSKVRLSISKLSYLSLP